MWETICTSVGFIAFEIGRRVYKYVLKNKETHITLDDLSDADKEDAILLIT